MDTVGTCLYLLNILLFCIFTVASLLRMLLFPWALRRTLRHKASSLFVVSWLAAVIPLKLLN